MAINGEPTTSSRRHLTPIQVGISSAAEGAVVVAAAPGPGKRIVLLRYAGAVGDDVEIDWRSDATTLAGPMPLARGHVFADGGHDGLGACDVNKALNLHLSAAVRVSLLITYAIE